MSSKLFCSNQGETLFTQHCLSCHSTERMSFLQMKEKRSILKAPPINLVSQRLRKMISIKVDDEDVHKAVVVAYIKEYIQHPSMDIGLCRVSCYIQYGQMPKIGSNMTQSELSKVSAWVYE
nr:c-type cytochrome [Sulfurimonas sp. MAG313]